MQKLLRIPSLQVNVQVVYGSCVLFRLVPQSASCTRPSAVNYWPREALPPAQGINPRAQVSFPHCCTLCSVAVHHA